MLHAGLGLGRTLHSEPAKEGEVTRKGISCERTFAAISSREDLEAKVGTAALCAASNRVSLVMDCLTHQTSAVHSLYVATGRRIWSVWSLQATAVCTVHASHPAYDSDMGQAAQLPPPRRCRTHAADKVLSKLVHLMLCATFSTMTVHKSTLGVCLTVQQQDLQMAPLIPAAATASAAALTCTCLLA